MTYFYEVPRRELLLTVTATLRERLDPMLRPYGFARRGNARIYRRPVEGGRQLIDFITNTHPRIDRAGVRLSPQAEIDFPAVNEMVEHILGPGVIPESNEYTERVLVDTLTRADGPWIARDQDELTDLVVGPIAEILVSEILPVFERATSIAGFATLPDDDAFLIFAHGRARWIHWTVSKIMMGDREGAMAVLNRIRPDDPARVAVVQAFVEAE